jgi:hypothetical protein
MAHDALADEADLEAGLERGDPAAAVLAATQAERLSAPALGSLYRVLDGVLLPPALRLALWNIVFQRVSDTEEAARRREQRRANWDDPDLRRWLREGLAGYGPGTSVAPDDELPQPWLVLVPPRWYAALGFGPHVDALKPVRHSAALPIYAVADHDDLGPMADALVELAAEPVDGRMGGDQSPQLLARQLRRRLWPRAVRCRAALGEAIALLAEMRSPAHAAAGLEIVGRALGEETDRRLLDLREELERAARALAPDVCGAQALQAAGQAYAPTNPQRALELWDEAARLARKQEPGARRELLGRFVLDWLDLVEDPAAHGVEGPLLTMSAETALEAGDPEVLLETLLSVSARPAGRLREALLKRLGEREALLDPRGRFLLAWVRDDRTARLEAAQALWAHPGFGDEDWAWTALALASRVRYGDEPLLRRAMVALRLQAKCGQPEALAGWLACAYASDRLDERESRPEACRALEAVMALTGERLRLPLVALQSTCATPDPRWLAEVETVLMKRLHDIERAAHTRHDELAAIESVACVLYPAHIAAHLEVWWRQYQGTWA